MCALINLVHEIGKKEGVIEVADFYGGEKREEEQKETNIGWVVFVGVVLKRGPMGRPVMVKSEREYHEIFGDPRDWNWHLYESYHYREKTSKHPEILEGYFRQAREFGRCIVIRNERDGKGRKAKKILFSSGFADGERKPVLEIRAANEGKWGGESQLPVRCYIASVVNGKNIIVVNYEREVLENQYQDGEFYFINKETGEESNRYKIVFHTASLKESFIELDKNIVFSDPFFRDINNYYRSSVQNFLGLSSYTVDSEGRLLTVSSNNTKVRFSHKYEGRGKVYITEEDNVLLRGENTNFSFYLDEGDLIYIGPTLLEVKNIVSDELVIVTERIKNLNKGEKYNYSFYCQDSIFVEIEDITRAHVLFNSIEKIRNIVEEKIVFDGKEFSFRQLKLLRIGENKVILKLRVVEKEKLLYQEENSLKILNSWLKVNGRVENIEKGEIFYGPEGVFRVLEKSGEYIKTSRVNGENYTNKPLLVPKIEGVMVLSSQEKKGLAVEVYPSREKNYFGMIVSFNGSVVLDYPKLSLLREDPNFVETVVKKDPRNSLVLEKKTSVPKWIEVESLVPEGEQIVFDKEKDYNPSNLCVKVKYVDTVRGKVYFLENFLRESVIDIQRGKVHLVEGSDFISFTCINLKNTKRIKILSTERSQISTKEELKEGELLFLKYRNGQTRLRFVIRKTQENRYVLDGEVESLQNILDCFRLGSFEVLGGYISLFYEEQIVKISFPEVLWGGYDGGGGKDKVNVLKYLDINRNLIESYARGKNLGLLRIATPGYNSYDVIEAGIQYAENHAYEYKVEVPSSIKSVEELEIWLSTVRKSDFTTIFYPSYGNIVNKKGEKVFCSLVGDVLGEETYKAATKGSYYSVAAGIDAVLTRVVDVYKVLSDREEEFLNEVGFQLIVYKKEMFRIWGINSYSSSRTFRKVGVKRTHFHYLRVFMEEERLYSALFRPLNEVLVQEINLFFKGFFEKEIEKGNIASHPTILFRPVYTEKVDSSVISEFFSNKVNLDNSVILAKNPVSNTLIIYIAYVPVELLENIVIMLMPNKISTFNIEI